MTNAEILAKVENERLFGESVDIFKNYYIVLGIANILKKIGLRTSHDNDWFRTTSPPKNFLRCMTRSCPRK